MKLRIIAALLLISVLPVFVSAEQVTFIDNTGANVTVDLPSEVASIIKENHAAIQNELTAEGVTAATIQDVAAKVNDVYRNLGDYGVKSMAPITDAKDGLNDLSDILVRAVPDSQMQQNVWAKAWLGEKLHVGGGLNAGFSFMSIGSLLDAAEAIGVDTSDIPSSIPFPTLTADVRASLPFMPLDVGVTFSLLDTNKLSGLSHAFDHFNLDFYNFGFDFRYPLIKHGPLNSVLSLGGGFYYTKGGMEVTGKEAGVAMDYKAATFKINAQYSLDLSVIVPFVGARVAFTQSSADWEINVDWKNVYSNTDDENEWIARAQNWGVLPSKFSGGSSCSFTDSIRPQLYGGIGLELACFNFTVSGCFDFNSMIPSLALSARLCF